MTRFSTLRNRVAAEQLRIKTEPIGQLPLKENDRATLAALPIAAKLKTRLLADSTDFTVAEIATLVMTVAEELPDADPKWQVALLMATQSLMDCLQRRITDEAILKLDTAKKAQARPATLFQFKITLVGSEPPIWRRIQVANCTLNTLHEHIQTAMGWTNSHLHQFEIEGERFGDPDLLDDGFEDFECVDSLDTMISDLVPEDGRQYRFLYEYDFGDGWEHDVLFEGCPPVEKNQTYPVCLEGERNCPPEDAGGVWGYRQFLEVIADPKHEQHEEYKEWAGNFDPEEFSAAEATNAMRSGLPDWREA